MPRTEGRLTEFSPTLAPLTPVMDQGTVVSNVFLGSTRDYVVEARDGTHLRITAAPEQSFAPGAPVWVTMPRERCRALLS